MHKGFGGKQALSTTSILGGNLIGLKPAIPYAHLQALATWVPIQWEANNGYKLFDFMSAGNPFKDYGVRKFKAKIWR